MSLTLALEHISASKVSLYLSREWQRLGESSFAFGDEEASEFDCCVSVTLTLVLRDRSLSTAIEPLPLARDGGVRGWRRARPVYFMWLGMLANKMSYDA